MKRRITTYLEYMDNLIDRDDEKTDWNEVYRLHLIKTEFFQHERLVHLLVLMLVALLMMAAVAISVISGYIYMLLVTAGLLILLVPYIMHYYFLENSVQKMYDQFDKIYEHVKAEQNHQA